MKFKDIFRKKSKIGKFSKGDRVILNSMTYLSLIGSPGTIIEVFNKSTYRVKADKYRYQVTEREEWFAECELEFLKISGMIN